MGNCLIYCTAELTSWHLRRRGHQGGAEGGGEGGEEVVVVLANTTTTSSQKAVGDFVSEDAQKASESELHPPNSGSADVCDFSET